MRNWAYAPDAALTLPVWLQLLKSCAPCNVVFWGGFLPVQKRVS